MHKYVFHAPIIVKEVQTGHKLKRHSKKLFSAIHSLVDENLAEYTDYDYVVGECVSVAYDERVDLMYSVTEVHTKKKLTKRDICNIMEEISGQFSDGWGENFEQEPIDVEGAEYYVSFWDDNDNWVMELTA